MATKILVTYMSKDVTEDKYGEGESRDTQTIMDEKVHLAAFPRDVKNLLAERYGLPDRPENWMVFDGRLICEVLEDADGTEATEGEVNAWKQGRLPLWAARYDFNVMVISEKKTTSKELTRLTGIKNYD